MATAAAVPTQTYVSVIEIDSDRGRLSSEIEAIVATLEYLNFKM
jgi:hypothetical protein